MILVGVLSSHSVFGGVDEYIFYVDTVHHTWLEQEDRNQNGSTLSHVENASYLCVPCDCRMKNMNHAKKM